MSIEEPTIEAMLHRCEQSGWAVVLKYGEFEGERWFVSVYDREHHPVRRFADTPRQALIDALADLDAVRRAEQ